MKSFRTFLQWTAVATVAVATVGTSSSATAQERPQREGRGRNAEILFDGSNVDKWRAFKREGFPDKGWKIEDGTLKTIPGGDEVDIVTKEKYDNFVLMLEWKVSPGANSGIMYRVSEEFGAAWHTGAEYQVLDDSKHADGKNPKTSAGSLYALIAPQDKELKPVGEWNRTRILVRGSHVEHWLNGKKVVEFELGSPETTALIAGSKFKDMPKFTKEATGHIVLQHHHDEVWFRNIRVRKISATQP